MGGRAGGGDREAETGSVSQDISIVLVLGGDDEDVGVSGRDDVGVIPAVQSLASFASSLVCLLVYLEDGGEGRRAKRKSGDSTL